MNDLSSELNSAIKKQFQIVCQYGYETAMKFDIKNFVFILSSDCLRNNKTFVIINMYLVGMEFKKTIL